MGLVLIIIAGGAEQIWSEPHNGAALVAPSGAVAQCTKSPARPGYHDELGRYWCFVLTSHKWVSLLTRKD